MDKSLLLEIQHQAHAQSTMNLCIVSFQAVLLAVLLVQYHYINEVEAEKIPRYPNGNWFNSVEKRIEIVQGRMNEAYQQIKEKAKEIFSYSRSLMHKAVKTRTSNKDTVNKNYNDGLKIDDLFQSYEEKRDLLAANGVTDNMTYEDRNDAEPEAQVVMEPQEPPKRKKKIIKKHKKKIRTNHVPREHVQHEQREYVSHVPHEQRLDASVEQDKEEYDKRVLRKDHKKREKQERFNQRKFVKTSQKESNSSESDEVKRRKPVDIIVHIKMND